VLYIWNVELSRRTPLQPTNLCKVYSIVSKQMKVAQHTLCFNTESESESDCIYIELSSTAYLLYFRCSSRSSVSEKHLMGPFMSVCRLSPTGVGILHDRKSLLHNNMTAGPIFGTHCCLTMGREVVDGTYFCATVISDRIIVRMT
jgi:hypothetical protein